MNEHAFRIHRQASRILVKGTANIFGSALKVFEEALRQKGFGQEDVAYAYANWKENEILDKDVENFCLDCLRAEQISQMLRLRARKRIA